jgi:MFS family permease
MLSRDEVRRSLRVLVWESMASTGFSSVTASTFLVAFALVLGASNFQIGVLASLPFITDLVQIPAVWLVERLRRRKAIVMVTWLVSQLLWIPVALIPLAMALPDAGAVSMLLGIMAARGILNALTNCGWSSWKRDLVPQHILGRYFARRLSLATAVAVVSGLSAGYFLEHWGAGDGGAIGYSCVLLVGLAFFGLASPALMALIPEPRMPPAAVTRSSFSQTITTPLRDPNYRQFLRFLLSWGFASNMVVPFFTVFMLRELDLPIFTVISLAMLSGIFTVISLRFWGTLADRFGSKTILYLSTMLFLLVLAGWALTAGLGDGALLVPLLAIMHVITGIAVAGMTLTAETLSFKLAPHGRATPYLVGASLADSAGAGLGALAGGFLADFLAGRAIVLDLSRAVPFQYFVAAPVQLTGFHLIFALAFVLGILTLRILKSVRENGATRGEAVLPVLIADLSLFFHRAYATPCPYYLNRVLFIRPSRAGETVGPVETTSRRFRHAGRNAAQVVPSAEHGLQPPSSLVFSPR